MLCLTEKALVRNPNQPENEVPIPERVVVKFKAGKVMKEKVHEIDPAALAE